MVHCMMLWLFQTSLTSSFSFVLTVPVVVSCDSIIRRAREQAKSKQENLNLHELIEWREKWGAVLLNFLNQLKRWYCLQSTPAVFNSNPWKFKRCFGKRGPGGRAVSCTRAFTSWSRCVSCFYNGLMTWLLDSNHVRIAPTVNRRPFNKYAKRQIWKMHQGYLNHREFHTEVVQNNTNDKVHVSRKGCHHLLTDFDIGLEATKCGLG